MIETQKEARKLANRKYWKTAKGKLMMTYNNMNRRVKGIQKKKAHLYEGLELLSRDDFYSWSLKSLGFEVLYNDWVLSNYDRKLSPSIDRVDSSKGYNLSNMRWVTHSENSRLGSISKHNDNDNNE
jgi:hypothetical protein